MRQIPRPIQHGAGDVALPAAWRLCKRCAVGSHTATPAAYIVPGGPPSFHDILACEDHAAPYKTKRPLT